MSPGGGRDGSQGNDSVTMHVNLGESGRVGGPPLALRRPVDPPRGRGPHGGGESMPPRGLPSDHRDARPHSRDARRDQAPDRRHGQGHEVRHQVEEGWLMPWQRPPAWLYLPHLTDSQPPFGNGEASGGVRTEGRAAAEDEADSRTCDGCESGAGSAAAHAVAGGGGGAAFGGEIDTIRGRTNSPGSRADGGRIRGLGTEPGNRAARARLRAEARLEAANAHLGRSLRDHAERVAKRRAEEMRLGGGTAARALSATERIEAIRRRLAARSGGVAREDDCAVQGAAHRPAAEAAAASSAAWHGVDGPAAVPLAGVAQLSGP